MAVSRADQRHAWRHRELQRSGGPDRKKPRWAVRRCLDADGGTGAMKSAADANYRRLGKAPAGMPGAGFALLLVLAMAQFMVVLDFTIVNVALPSIQDGLHVATTTLQWLLSGFAVAFGGFLLLGGRLADVFGRAKLFRIDRKSV